jgi:hypothetical protein
MGRMPATEPSLDGEAGCRGTRVSVEPSETGRRGPVLRNAWQRRSPPRHGGRVQSQGMRDSVGALLDEEAGPMPRGTWQYMDTCPTLCYG